MSKKRWPFHESIILTIECMGTQEVKRVAQIITQTSVPKNHDAIITAWNKRLQQLECPPGDYGVPDSLLEQKREADEKSKENKPSDQAEAPAVAATTGASE